LVGFLLVLVIRQRRRPRLGPADNAPEVPWQFGPALLALLRLGVQLQKRRQLPLLRQANAKARRRVDDARLLDRQQLAERIFFPAALLLVEERQRHRVLAGQDDEGAAAVGDVLLQADALGQRQLLRRGVAEDDTVEAGESVGLRW